MNKIQASKELKISVRSLQRLVQTKVLNVVYKRGDSGKQEAVFDADAVAKYKLERDAPSSELAHAPTYAKNLARSNTGEFLNLLRDALTAKSSVVPVADKLLLKVSDCRMLTGLSERRIVEAIKAERLKATFIGKGWKIKRRDLDAFINEL